MKSVIVWCMGGGTYAGGGIGRRAGNKRGVHNGLQLMGIADMTAECTMCGDKSTPGILRSRKAVEHGRMRSTTRKSIPKMYEGCKTCPNNISGYGKCKIFVCHPDSISAQMSVFCNEKSVQ